MYKIYARSEGKKHNLSFESWGITARYLYFIIHGAIKVAIRQVWILEAYTQGLCFQEKGCVYWLGFRLCAFYSYYFPLRMIKKPKSWSDGSVPVRSKALFSARNKTPKLKKKVDNTSIVSKDSCSAQLTWRTYREKELGVTRAAVQAGHTEATRVRQAPTPVCKTLSPLPCRVMCQSQHLEVGAIEGIISERGNNFWWSSKEGKSAVFHRFTQLSIPREFSVH